MCIRDRPEVAATQCTADKEFLAPSRPVRVLVAGGGIAGLVLAVSLLKKGVDVKIFEQDMTAIRGEGKYRGPIQVRLVSIVLHLGLACVGDQRPLDVLLLPSESSFVLNSNDLTSHAPMWSS